MDHISLEKLKELTGMASTNTLRTYMARVEFNHIKAYFDKKKRYFDNVGLKDIERLITLSHRRYISKEVREEISNEINKNRRIKYMYRDKRSYTKRTEQTDERNDNDL